MNSELHLQLMWEHVVDILFVLDIFNLISIDESENLDWEAYYLAYLQYMRTL